MEDASLDEARKEVDGVTDRGVTDRGVTTLKLSEIVRDFSDIFRKMYY